MKNKIKQIIKILNVHNKEVIIFLPFLLIIVVTNMLNIMYIPFIIIIALKLLAVYYKKTSLDKALLSIAIYSIIVPDNFTVIGASGLLLLYCIYKSIKVKGCFKLDNFKKDIKIIIPVAIFLILNIIINVVPIMNVVFFGVYYFVFVVMIIIYRYFNIDFYKEVDKTFNSIILIQFIYLILFIPIRFQYILTQLIGDWSIGTLGISEGPTLFNLFIFGFMKYFGYFEKHKNKRYYLVFAALCFLGAMSTVSVSLTLVFFVSFGLYILIHIRSPKFKASLIVFGILMMGLFWFTSNPWIRNEIIKTATDSQFRKERITKLKYYEDTFLTIPKDDAKFMILGNGMGYYSSRAALTTSGYYVSWYNYNKPYFKPTVSDYTNEYIKPSIYSAYGISLTEHPGSQYISIMGEFGLIGILLFLIFFWKLFKNGGNINKLMIGYFLAILLLDNWIEFPRVAIAFVCMYYLIKEEDSQEYVDKV
ncbi:hypothetical protein [Clostridium algidicarnis]|uniref:hypothetical protein n=1 Tax=Clostridium algidicarnis TaxID=37659 RepID=UPI000494F5CB|nr:hypothetical protein [Clostridium algidicarnis]